MRPLIAALGLGGRLGVNVLVAALVSESALALLESVADVGSGTTALAPSSESLLASVVASVLANLPAVLASSRLVLELLLGVELLLTGAEDPLVAAILSASARETQVKRNTLQVRFLSEYCDSPVAGASVGSADMVPGGGWAGSLAQQATPG